MTVVYASNRDWYKHLPTAIGSLLYHNPDAFVYIIAEDDQIDQIQRTKNIKIININYYPSFIDPKHPNADSHWTIFALMRCFLTKIIDDDKILWLDVDTIVKAPLDELWNMDMTNLAIAGWCEPKKNWTHVCAQKSKSNYVNSGILLMNLKFIKDHGLDDKYIKYLSGGRLKNPDQDALNVVCDGYIGYLTAEYNFGPIITIAERHKYYQSYKIYHMTWYKLWNPKVPGPHHLYNEYYREILY